MFELRRTYISGLWAELLHGVVEPAREVKRIAQRRQTGEIDREHDERLPVEHGLELLDFQRHIKDARERCRLSLIDGHKGVDDELLVQPPQTVLSKNFYTSQRRGVRVRGTHHYVGGLMLTVHREDE